MEISFTTKLVGEKIWSIAGPANDLMYLVLGGKKAMLVDTGMGVGDLLQVITTLTPLPVVVINTHGHPDHAGGNSNFDEVWLPEKDEPIRQIMCTEEFRRNDLKALLGQEYLENGGLWADLVRSKPYTIHYVHPGDSIDLGERQFEIIEFPGHTPGSICLLSKAEKILFSGDSIVATPVWLFLEHSLPLRTYHDALKRVAEKSALFEEIFPGHQPTPLGKEHLLDLITCAEEILSRPGTGEPTTTFAGKGLSWSHGKGQIIYNPENIS